MEIKGKLIQVLPLQTGEGKNGPWKKQDIVLETEAQYPKKVCISIWGDKVSESQLQPGNVLNVSFDLESREFNGKWYTDVKAWKVESASASAPSQSQSQSAYSSAPPSQDLPVYSSEPLNVKDDLPF